MDGASGGRPPPLTQLGLLPSPAGSSDGMQWGSPSRNRGRPYRGRGGRRGRSGGSGGSRRQGQRRDNQESNDGRQERRGESCRPGGRNRCGNWSGQRGRGNRVYSQDRLGFSSFPDDGASRSQSVSNNQHKRLVSRLSLWTNEPSDVIVLNINSNKQSDLKELLASDLPSDEMRLFIKVLSIATTSDSCRQGVLDIFSEVFSEEFIAKLLKFQLTVSNEEVENLKDFLQDQHQLLYSFFKAMPFDALDKITELLHTVQLILQKRVTEHPDEGMTEVLKLYEGLLEHFNKYLQVKEKNTGTKSKRNVRDKLAVLDSLSPGDDYRNLSTEPTFDDIISNREPFVRRNIVMGPYADVDTYLDVQFRLLREDFIRPLREGVNDYIFHRSGNNQNVRIYKGVRFVRSDITRGKLVFSVKLNLPKKFKLETSKRLMFGNLICVTNDNFATFFLALIAEKQDNMLKQGIVGISPLSKVDINFSSTYTLVESTAFFVAYKHVLKALQRMDSENFPLVEHIVYVQQHVDPPAYLQGHPNSMYDMSVILNPKFMKETLSNSIFETLSSIKAPPRTALSRVSVTAGLEEWPPASSFKLDHSQLLALHAALTSRLAIIQGPPGTGKTFLGLKIVQTLLHNSVAWSPVKKVAVSQLAGRFARVSNETTGSQPPILVVCFTNHALDQFLEGMENFTSKIVRIGGRSKNEQIQKYQINEVLYRMKWRKLLPSYLTKANGLIYSEFSQVETSFKKLQMQLIRLTKTEGLLSFSCLKRLEIIPPEIADQFNDSSYREWILPKDQALTHDDPTAPMRSIWETGHREGDELKAEETEENEQWLDALELTRDEEQNRMIDDDSFFDVDPGPEDIHARAIHDSDIRASDVEFEILTSTVEIELELISCQMRVLKHSPDLAMRHTSLTNKLLCLRRLASFAKVDVRKLELASEMNIHSLCFQDRCLLYTTWKQELEDRKNTLDFAITDDRLDFEILHKMQTSLLVIKTFSGVIKWDTLLKNEVVPPFIANQLSTRTFLSWILPEELEVQQAPVRSPMWKIWRQKNNVNLRHYDAADEVTWKHHMEMVRSESSKPQSSSYHPNFFTVHSRSSEFEVLFENYDEKLIELSSMIGKTLTDRDYHTLANEILKEKECLRRVLTFLKKNVTNLKLKNHVNVRELAFKDRCLLYATWRQTLINKYQDKCRPYEQMAQELTTKMEEIKRSRYLYVARQSHVVGMTTTGAAENQAMIHDLRPKIVVIEEAAEILEAHVVTALAASCEHLIMIGDHQQLKPSAAVYELATKYGLETSMFERMIKNGLPYQTLEYQHRMRPEISRLLVPAIYPKLKDHESVSLRPAVRGISSSVFFVSHHEKERADSDDNKSHSNPHEAEYIMQLARHLVVQGYSTNQITVLTPYSGQFFLLKQELRKLPECSGMHVTIVDNYQGEENDIILLSLVRSNDRGVVGFLKIENRVCVALSRAKQGLYIIGNLDQFCESSPLWVKIKEALDETNSVGEALTLRCQNHPDEVSGIKKAHEFALMSPEGGCRKSCDAQLPKCSHLCPRKCHVDDPMHDNFKCKLPCEKKCKLGTHDCLALCWTKCPSCCVKVSTKLPCGHSLKVECHLSTSNYIYCPIKVEKEIPSCKHISKMDCSKDPSTVECVTPCPARLDCGHACRQTCHVQNDPEHRKYQCETPCALTSKNCSQQHLCPLKCYEECKDCEVEVTKKAVCGHTCLVKCSFDMKNYVCKMPCKRMLQCGHRCPQKCWQKCGGCQVKVEKKHHKCGHTAKVPCSVDVDDLDCEAACDEQLPNCGHNCPRKCSETCGGCTVTVVKKLSKCGHMAIVPCNLDLSTFVCQRPCEKIMCCGHVCPQKCCASCGGCQELVDKKYPNCDHKMKVACDFDVNSIRCGEACKRLLSCGHICPQLCSDSCGNCRVIRKKTLPDCNHTAMMPCSTEPLHSMCVKNCERSLPCMHPCDQPCRAPCTDKCLVLLDYVEKCLCGHDVQMPCYMVSTITELSTTAAVSELCTAPCSADLECGHKCRGTCSSCRHGRLHRPCREPCQRRLLCGHSCPSLCGEPCPPCPMPCRRRCFHGLCRALCSDSCTRCTKKCVPSCPHSAGCGKDCSECSCAPCKLACPKTLPCGHACVGYCGDPCPSICRVCDNEQIKMSCLREMTPEELAVARFVLLPGCGHNIEQEGLLAFLSDRCDVVRAKRCPLCREPIFNCSRFTKILGETCQKIQNVNTEYRKDIQNIDTLSGYFIDPLTNDVDASFLVWDCVRHSLLMAAVFPHVQKSVTLKSKRNASSPKTRANRHYCPKELHKFHFQTHFLINAKKLYIEFYKKEKLQKDLSKLVETVMDETVVLSNQFRGEVTCELQRMALQAAVSSLRKLSLSQVRPRLTAIDRHMDHTKPFSIEKEFHVQRLLKKSKDDLVPKLFISESLRVDSSVWAVKMMSEHAWSVCSKGHVQYNGNERTQNNKPVCTKCVTRSLQHIHL